MILVTWIISIIFAFYLGYQLDRIKKAIATIQATLEEKKDKPKTEEPKSIFIDPDDKIQQAKFEHEQMMKKLNPDYDE